MKSTEWVRGGGGQWKYFRQETGALHLKVFDIVRGKPVISDITSDFWQWCSMLLVFNVPYSVKSQALACSLVAKVLHNYEANNRLVEQHNAQCVEDSFSGGFECLIWFVLWYNFDDVFVQCISYRHTIHAFISLYFLYLTHYLDEIHINTLLHIC